MRVEIHVRPNASKTAVGGEHDGALVVRVTEPAEAGRATDAALAAVAKALRVRVGAVRLVRGATSRRKLVDVQVTTQTTDSVATTLRRLLDA
jgi:uncharacterized protein YggU (UPF0235/DUF167 family)